MDRESTPKHWWQAVWVRDALCLLVLATISVAAFWPAEHRYFAGDQFDYFAELHGDRSFSILYRYWDYNAIREYFRGDQALFRPLSYALLGTEAIVFSYHPFGWNLTALAAHVLIVFFLYKLLWTIYPSPLAIALAVLFSVLNAHIELVLWNHLTSYLIAFIFLLLAMMASIKIIEGDGRKWFWIFLVCGLMGSLMYEIVAGLIALLAIHTLLARRTKAVGVPVSELACIVSPSIVYGLLYALYIILVSPQLLRVDRSRGFQALTPLALVLKIGVTIFGWLREMLVPWNFGYQIVPGSRFRRLSVPMEWLQETITGIAITVFIPICLIGAFRLAALRRNWRWLVLIAAMIGAFAAAVCIGRGEWDLQHITSYYLYLFSLLAILFFYLLLDLKRLELRKQYLAALAILLLAGANFLMTRDFCVRLAKADRAWETYYGRLAAFCDEHRAEPGFTFTVAHPPRETDHLRELVVGWNAGADSKTELKWFAQIVFAPWYQPDHPKYVLPP